MSNRWLLLLYSSIKTIVIVSDGSFLLFLLIDHKLIRGFHFVCACCHRRHSTELLLLSWRVLHLQVLHLILKNTLQLKYSNISYFIDFDFEDDCLFDMFALKVNPFLSTDTGVSDANVFTAFYVDNNFLLTDPFPLPYCSKNGILICLTFLWLLSLTRNTSHLLLSSQWDC